MDTEDTETIVNKYLNEYFEKTNDEKDMLKFVTIWKFLCNNPVYFKKLIKRKNIIGYLNTMPDIKYSGALHSNYLAGWRVKTEYIC